MVDKVEEEEEEERRQNGQWLRKKKKKGYRRILMLCTIAISNRAPRTKCSWVPWSETTARGWMRFSFVTWMGRRSYLVPSAGVQARGFRSLPLLPGTGSGRDSQLKIILGLHVRPTILQANNATGIML
ncbi:hypothetical protein GQ457_12G020820 [Hibiscus cannabinus]